MPAFQPACFRAAGDFQTSNRIARCRNSGISSLKIPHAAAVQSA